MRTALTLCLFLLLAGCGGGHRTAQAGPQNPPAGNTQTPAVQPTPNPDAGSVRLTLSADPDGDGWRVNLNAPQASDLYQVGGTLAFDATKYTVVGVEAGGGLGQPDSSYFVGKETSPGHVAFAYTKRYWGDGASGKLWLVSLRVRPTATFNLSDFKLDPNSKLMARDSKKRVMQVEAGGAQ